MPIIEKVCYKLAKSNLAKINTLFHIKHLPSPVNLKAWDSWHLASPVLPSWVFVLLQLLLSHNSDWALLSVLAWRICLGWRRSEVSFHLRGCLSWSGLGSPLLRNLASFRGWLVGAAHHKVGYYPQKQESQAKSCSVPKPLDAEIQPVMKAKQQCVQCHHRNCASAKAVAAQAELKHVSPPKLSSEGPSPEVLLNKTHCVVMTDGFKHWQDPGKH